MSAAQHRGKRLDIEKRPGDALRVAFTVRERIRDAHGRPLPGKGPVLDISEWPLTATAGAADGDPFALTVEFLTDGTDGKVIVSGTVGAMAAIVWTGHWHLRRTDVAQTVAYGRIIMKDPEP